MLKHIIAVVAAMLIGNVATAKETFTFIPERTLHIVGGIGGLKALQTADNIITLAERDPSQPIQLFINSPGGEVLTGMQIIAAIDVVKARGVKVQCFVSTIAASMAFHILGACDERYTLRTSLLLWHPAAVMAFGVRIDKKAAKTLYIALDALERALNPRLIKELGISPEVFYMHHEMETFHPGIVLQRAAPNFLKLVDDVQGIKTNLFVPRGANAEDDEE